VAIEHKARRVFDLSTASILVFEQTLEEARAVGQTLCSFGARRVREVHQLAAARAVACEERFELIIADPHAGMGQAMDFLQWVRRAPEVLNRFAPVILLAAQTSKSPIATLRAAGANFIIAKPYSIATLRNRIDWVGKDQRPFVETEVYVGPCRRITPGGKPIRGGRRAADALLVDAAS
jgi:DNA-binding response OmpR family regulator